jgi:hypothetical protein
LTRFFARLATRGPALVVIEDLQLHKALMAALEHGVIALVWRILAALE